ncbi:MFS transporter [Alicyclobacillus acidiphilus]|uniref:MFS transporter n=1 Tax=Alicyclobacillus acidiphilus TaxID=182455 RepID=UPI001470292C|nr:MFS transporter [Alicyclobacillus acidiphilus]
MNRFLWASYGMYGLGGMTSVFFGAIMPELLAHYHVNYTSAGLLILLQSIGFMIGVPITVRCMSRTHYRVILSSSALAIVVAQTGILLLPNFVWVQCLVIVNGAGASALETAVASYIMEMFVGRRAGMMSRLEVAFGLGALVMPAVSSGFIAMNLWRLSSLLVAIFAFVLAMVWMTMTSALPASSVGKHAEERSTPPPVFRGVASKYAVLSLFLLMILVYVGVEGSLNGFLPSIVTTYLKTRPGIAALSTSVFWIAMVVGRTAIGWIVRRVAYQIYLLGSVAAGIGCLLLFSQARSLVAAYATIFGLGLAMSAVYSVTMVYANHTFPGMERFVTSAVTGFAGIGGAVCPAIVGYAMDHILPGQVLWLILAFVVTLFVVLAVIVGCISLVRHRRRAGTVNIV